MRFIPLSSAAIILVLMSACAAQQDGDANPNAPPSEPTNQPAEPKASEPVAGQGQVEGKVGGDSFAVADARIFTGRLSERDATRRGVRIVLSAQSNACGHPDTTRPGHRTLSFDIGTRDKTSTDGELTIDPGTYSVPAALAANATSVVARLDARTASCSSASVVATDGIVTIEEATSTHVRGTFDLRMGTEHVTGRFDAPACPTSQAPVLSTRCEQQ